MADVEVVTSEVRAAAGKVGQAADGVSAAAPASSLDKIPAALPGGTAAAAARELATAWKSRFSDWHEDAVGQQDNLVASAATYDGHDEAAAGKLAQMGPRPVAGG